MDEDKQAMTEVPAEFRFYAELNDFLPAARRGRCFRYSAASHASLKHVIETLGVPHTEVGLLMVNGNQAPMERRLSPNDRVSVLPVFRRIREAPAGEAPRFIADAHLGRLARYLRFAGVDTLWRNAWHDAELVALAEEEGRVVLTRDRALLMRRDLAAGCYLRDKDPLAQFADVAWRYALDGSDRSPGRCLECNAPPVPVPKEQVASRLMPGTLAAFDEFWCCPVCVRVYWRGSHWRRMKAAVEARMPGVLLAADLA